MRTATVKLDLILKPIAPLTSSDGRAYRVIMHGVVDHEIGAVFQVHETIERRAKGLRYALGRRTARTWRRRHSGSVTLTWRTLGDAVDELVAGLIRKGAV